MLLRRVLAVISVAAGLAGCATVHNIPLNEPSANPFAGTVMQAAAASNAAPANDGGEAIGLAFSGGGTRAAAFADGVLTELAHTPAPRGGKGDLLDRVRVVSGVSGGSVMAAYYGLKGRSALDDVREKFLIQDVMASLDTRIDLINVSKALNGGINTDNRLRDWFNANLFHHATYREMFGPGRPIVLINATDIYNRSPFLFAPPTFAAFCSDLSTYPVAAAVSASAAVPAAFAPVVIETFPGQCNVPLPEWVNQTARDSAGSPQLHAFAEAITNAHTGKVKYIKLLDGGLVDNYGLSGVTIARTASGTPYGPLRPQEAIKMRRLLFIVVDAGQGPEGQWAHTLEGPTGKDLVTAVVDVLVDANARSSYTAFEATMRNWRDALVRWRCGLKPEEVIRLRGGNRGWNCRDLKIEVARVAFGQLDPERARRLNRVPTTFTLPAVTVDELIGAGRDALKANPAFQQFARGL